MTVIAVTILLTGVLTLLISLPLKFRKIPMNGVYGIRIPAAFKSNERWYEINAYGGRVLANWSWLTTATGVIGLFLPEDFRDGYALASLIIMVVALFIPILQILHWSRQK